MRFYSTSNASHSISFEDAVKEGLAANGGLFMPEVIDKLPDSFWSSITSKSFRQIGFEVASHFLKGAMPEQELKTIVDHTISFDAPLVKVEDSVYSLELYHGPTLAFKDFGARFLSGVLGYFAKGNDKNITILVATSGDTGSAVANGFLNVRGTRVVVLYPSGKVSRMQEQQFTTLGGNITAIEVDGTFDDCQRLVKEAFSDKDLKNEMLLTSANSINIARLLPQAFYYFYAYSQLKDKSKPLIFSVPSGNFGNLTAGLFAKRMGLPVEQFIASTNFNDIVPEYLQSGTFTPRPSKETISNAMDVGNPSNFARMLALYKDNYDSLSNDITGYSFSDASTREAIKAVNENGYLMDPHGAVGYLGLKKYLQANTSCNGIFLETAHPAKFQEVVEDTIGATIEIPERLQRFMNGEKRTVRMGVSFNEFRELLNQIR